MSEPPFAWGNDPVFSGFVSRAHGPAPNSAPQIKIDRRELAVNVHTFIHFGPIGIHCQNVVTSQYGAGSTNAFLAPIYIFLVGETSANSNRSTLFTQLNEMLSVLFLLAQPVLSAVLKRDIVDPGPPILTYPLAGMSPVGSPTFPSPQNVNAKYQHAVFLSVDGMHQSDLEWYVSTFPESTMASLLQHAIEYTNANCPSPSDSAPGTISPVTGCSPRTHGLYYDDAYDGALYPPGSNCTGPIGTQTAWDETLDLNDTVANGGGGFNQSMFPLQLLPSGYCGKIAPWDFVRTNTMFEYVRCPILLLILPG